MASPVQTILNTTAATARTGISQTQSTRSLLATESASSASRFSDALGNARHKPPAKPQAPEKLQNSPSKRASTHSSKSRKSRQSDEAGENEETAANRKAKRAAARPGDEHAPQPAAQDAAADEATAEAKPHDEKDQDAAALAAAAGTNGNAPPADPATAAADTEGLSPTAKIAQKATVRLAATAVKSATDDDDPAAATDEASADTGDDPLPNTDSTGAVSTKNLSTSKSAGAAQDAADDKVAPIKLGGAAVTKRPSANAAATDEDSDDAAADPDTTQTSAHAGKSSALPDILSSQAAELMQAAVSPNLPAKATKAATDDPNPTPAIEPPSAKGSPSTASIKAPPAPELPPETRFAEVNHPRIVTGVRGELLPNGGSMQLRLDPPELGDLQVTLHMRDGVMSAAFQTSNEQATRLLSHSLGDLKAMLESHGVSVQKLHVEQGPRDQRDSSSDSGQRQPTADEQHSARQDQQRKDMVQKMWDKLLRGGSPVDLVA